MKIYKGKRILSNNYLTTNMKATRRDGKARRFRNLIKKAIFRIRYR